MAVCLLYKGIYPLYLDAVVAVEDHRFEQHWGIDLIAIGRAAWNNLISWSLREGGSTITQQLAKNMYFTQEKSFIRKIAEMFMAFRLENAVSWSYDGLCYSNGEN
ncbi:biosynthetic peptidoglycan transglycosylase [Ruminococcus turbiniformis]|uniref:biosynthetic peptidoglycan transglycosylase n=1 Tax=Ruminococcus turbiniformis TaxID=2881258 RepID=UPI00389AE5EE